MGDFDFGSWSSQPENRHTIHQEGQGFRPPTDEPPFRNPPGWYGGAVRQTGGMVMVREWGTVPGVNSPSLAREKHREYEYEVAYGDQPGVSLMKYKWNDSVSPNGAYEFDGVVQEVPVPKDTAEAKARAAKKLMKQHSDKTK